MKKEDWEIELSASAACLADHVTEGGEETKGVPLNVVGILCGLILVNDALHHFDFLLTGESLQ